ncbi:MULTISPECIES: hypothetical protein [Acinetobacter]|nr:hypothetical protein [Acinetobacter terrae]OTG71050.1 hypothetical protein B9T23_15830 [Acinetobacter terrae]HEE6637844.1 hypothetical protein [Acinetobacter baumannii]
METIERYEKLSNEEDARYLLSYLNDVLIPASKEFFDLLDDNQIKLHHAFSFNAILAHAIDYMLFIANKQVKISRISFVKNFDQRYAVDGCSHINNKFSLLDAINNSFKHVELKKSRYIDLISLYGDLSFHSLKSYQGKVFFDMPLYRFDYARVVLRPISAIFDCGLNTAMDIDDFINGRICGSTGYGHFAYDYQNYDAIDRMIDYCGAECMDCGENGANCDCPSFIYANNRGEYAPNQDPNFDFNDVMSQISGTREWRKK